MSCENDFLVRLKERGFRLTPQREMILRVMHEIGAPSTADHVLSLVQRTSAGVDLSTVYRNLDLLVELGLVSVIDRSDQQKLYEYHGKEGPHIHLVCQRCGKITGVDIDEHEPLIKHLRESHQFQVDCSALTISGICSDCLSVEKDQSLK